jgi:RNA polymerase sigma-70 factor (ECF subfamily)
MRAEAPHVEPAFLQAATAAPVDWDDVYARELPRVLNFFRYKVGNRAAAEDLTSITFEKAWRGRAQYRDDRAAFSTWLFTIARNVAVDHFRASRPEVPIDGVDPASEATPEGDALRRSDAERLSALLAELAERERDLIALKYGAEHSNRAIAKMTGLTESNVGTILHRTIAALRARWEGKEGPHE